MTRIIPIFAIALILGSMWYLSRPAPPKSLELKYRYLVVDVDGPPDWEMKHRFSIEWQGKTVPLPVVIRSSESIETGAGPEIFRYLKIDKEKVPVDCDPPTEFQVRNMAGVALIDEHHVSRNVISFSTVTEVNVSPPEHPGKDSPLRFPKIDGPEAVERKSRLKKLINDGRVLDVFAVP